MPPITNDWADYLKDEFRKPYYRKLYQTIMPLGISWSVFFYCKAIVIL